MLELMRKARRGLSAFVGGLLLAAVGEAWAVLVGVSTVTDSYYSIDPASGAATFISTSDSNVSFSGLSFLGSTLYASDINGCPGCTGVFNVVSVNLATGGSTFVSNQGNNRNWHGLASNQSAGLLYSINSDLNLTDLKSLDPVTGTITTIGSTGIQGRGMAYADSTGILYATGPNLGVQSLFTVDTTTGTSTLIGSTGIDSFMVGLAFDESTGILYMVADPDNQSSGFSNLYTLNLATGAATLVGSTGINSIDGLDFSVTQVPEPATLALLGIALAGLGFRRRKRSN